MQWRDMPIEPMTRIRIQAQLDIPGYGIEVAVWPFEDRGRYDTTGEDVRAAIEACVANVLAQLPDVPAAAGS